MKAAAMLPPHVFDNPWSRAALIMAVALLVAALVRIIFSRVFAVLSARTRTDLDDRIILEIRGPLTQTILLAGLGLAFNEFKLGPTTLFVLLGVIKTAAVLVLARMALRVGALLVNVLSRQADRFSWIQPKTQPLFDIVLKVVVVGGALYFAFVAWDINVTSWVASAGIVGIAVGFAAKDTLANLFAGVFILADTPYKLGDYILLDDQLRGEVTAIGIRSTRILTRDDIEVTIPNAIIANSKIVNETSGRHPKMRVRVKVSAAYGSDVDQVRKVLLDCVQGTPHVSPRPEPRVRFRSFGDSGLNFELLVWIDQPVYRGQVLDALNGKVYKAFNQAGIEIPYTKYDVYIKEQPGPSDHN